MKRRIPATLPIVLLVGLCLPLLVQAQACPSSLGLGLLTPDGSPTTRSIDGAQTSSFLGDLSAGRSYSLDIVSAGSIAESGGGAAATLPVVARQPGAGDCSFSLSERTLTDPKIVVDVAGGPQQMAGRRFSFLAPTSGHYTFFVTNNDFFNLSHDVTARLVETTLFSPRWSTFGGFHTEFGFRNTTNTAINGTLTLFNDDGTVNTTSSFAVPVNGTVFRDTRAVAVVGSDGLNVADDKKGSAQFTHNGPRGAILADSFIVHPGFATGPFVVPGKFETTREVR